MALNRRGRASNGNSFSARSHAEYFAETNRRYEDPRPQRGYRRAIPFVPYDRRDTHYKRQGFSRFRGGMDIRHRMSTEVNTESNYRRTNRRNFPRDNRGTKFREPNATRSETSVVQKTTSDAQRGKRKRNEDIVGSLQAPMQIPRCQLLEGFMNDRAYPEACKKRKLSTPVSTDTREIISAPVISQERSAHATEKRERVITQPKPFDKTEKRKLDISQNEFVCETSKGKPVARRKKSFNDEERDSSISQDKRLTLGEEKDPYLVGDTCIHHERNKGKQGKRRHLSVDLNISKEASSRLDKDRRHSICATDISSHGSTDCAFNGNRPYPISSQNFSMSWENFLSAMLAWNPSWFEQKEKKEETNPTVKPPPDIVKEFFGHNPPRLYPLVERYEDYRVYSEKFMMPLLLYETWERCYCTWRDRKSKQKVNSHTLVLEELTPVGERLTKCTLAGLISETDKQLENYVAEGSLVKMKFVEKSTKDTRQTVLGLVDKVTFEESNTINSDYEEMDEIRKQLKNPLSMKMVVKIMRRHTRCKLIDLQGIGSIIDTKYEFEGLECLERSILCQDLLRPTANETFCDQAPPSNLTLQVPYNMSQLKAISTAVKMALQPQENPRVCLIRGPPGTGKSHTIIGIIQQIVKESRGKCPIFLCAPSALAVDELVKKIVSLSKTLDPSIRLVRLGKNCHADIRPYCLDQLVKRNIERAQQKQLPVKTLQGERESLKNKIQVMKSKLAYSSTGNSTSELMKYEKELQVIESKLNVASPQEEEQTRENVLLHSHVIAGTLSSMGSSVLRATFQKHPQNVSPVLIIDEATGALELDTLIPLQYGVSKLIMVGDPEQLPATVLSQVAEENKFSLSLFGRLNSYFMYSRGVNPVIFLDTQYRMDPAIAEFPNKHTYDKAIKFDESVINRNCQLKPYLLFNVGESMEVSQGSSGTDSPAEAIFIAELCQCVVDNSDFLPESIGIIVPSAKQKEAVNHQLRKSRRELEVEVSTVEGFQGKEMDVIILYCARVNDTGAVRFLASRNASLTKAKYAMYLVGNFDSLEHIDCWKDLIQDARERQKIELVRQCSSVAVRRVIRRQT